MFTTGEQNTTTSSSYNSTSNTSSSFTTSSAPNDNDAQADGMSLKTVLALSELYGCIGIACFVFGFALNALVFSYFYSRRKTLSNTLYCVIVIVDMLISALMLPYTLPHFSYPRTGFLFSSPDFCKFWTVVWGAASKSSVVLVAVLGIFRTILLVNPFNTSVGAVKKRYLLGIFLLYFMILMICETVPMWQNYRWHFDVLRMRCEWNDESSPYVCSNTCERVRTFGYVWNSVTLAVPVLPMLINAILSVYRLKWGKKIGDRGKKYASMTIVLFTLLYVVLNIPTLIYWIMMLIHFHSGYTTSLLKFDHPYYFYSNFVEVLSVALNSLLNPVLYLFRMKELRKYLTTEIEMLRGPPTGSQLSPQSTDISFASKGQKMSESVNHSVAQRNVDSGIPMENMNNIYS